VVIHADADDAEHEAASGPADVSITARAVAVLAWPLALLGPVSVWNAVVAVIASHTPDVVVDGRCTLPWGPCRESLVDIVTGGGTVGQPLVVLLGGELATTVVRGAPVRQRLPAVLVLLAAEAVFLTLVGITILRIGGDLG
jgi:hypothetical protein